MQAASVTKPQRSGVALPRIPLATLSAFDIGALDLAAPLTATVDVDRELIEPLSFGLGFEIGEKGSKSFDVFS